LHPPFICFGKRQEVRRQQSNRLLLDCTNRILAAAKIGEAAEQVVK
jgi:hypothetical protein